MVSRTFGLSHGDKDPLLSQAVKVTADMGN